MLLEIFLDNVDLPSEDEIGYCSWFTAAEGAGLLELQNGGTLFKKSFKQEILNFSIAQQ